MDNCHIYHDGTFVVHKITGHYKGKCSGYFDSEGNLTTADQVTMWTTGPRVRDVKKGGAIWAHVQVVGRRIYEARRTSSANTSNSQ